MTEAIVLDAGPLGRIAHPRPNVSHLSLLVKAVKWSNI